MFNPLDLSGKLILVTGASSGIGRETAIVLSRLGASVILCARGAGELRVTEEMMDGNGSVYVEPFDLGETDGIASWMQQVCARCGSGVHGVVHAAGVQITHPIRASNRKQLDEVMSINVSMLGSGCCAAWR